MDLDTLEYDLQNVTAGDYTIEMDISGSQYDDFVLKYQKEIDNDFEGSIANAFKHYLKNDVQAYLQNHTSSHENDGCHKDARSMQAAFIVEADKVEAVKEADNEKKRLLEFYKSKSLQKLKSD